MLDRSAEEIVVAELQAIHDQGYRFSAISEERGEIDFGDGPVRVIVDPIDGSTNAKRDALHYALSVAVADGDTMADVAFGFVHDFGCDEEWWAVRGEGAFLNGVLLDPSLGERRSRDGKLEMLGHRVGRSALDPGLDRRPGRLGAPPARAGHDRRHAVPGGGGAL